MSERASNPLARRPEVSSVSMSRIACDRVRAKFGTSLLFQVGRTTASCVCCDKEDENIVPSLLDRPLIKFRCFGAADHRRCQKLSVTLKRGCKESNDSPLQTLVKCLLGLLKSALLCSLALLGDNGVLSVSLLPLRIGARFGSVV